MVLRLRLVGCHRYGLDHRAHTVSVLQPTQFLSGAVQGLAEGEVEAWAIWTA